jgi:hypothetical protein
MGKGRMWTRALHSKVTPTGRWAPPPNARARCIGNQLTGKDGGGKAGVRTRFVEASGACHVKGK